MMLRIKIAADYDPGAGDDRREIGAKSDRMPAGFDYLANPIKYLFTPCSG